MKVTLQRKTDLALRALDVLDGAGANRLTGSDLADRVGTTTQFLPQVMGPLVKSGWVDSGRGPGGGYRLSTPLDHVSMLDVIEAIEGPTSDGRCVLRDGPCGGVDRCPIHGIWVEARDRLVDGLGRLTVMEALANGGDT